MRHKQPFPFSLETSKELSKLVMEILGEVQYIRLIVAKSPEAKIVHEVREILEKKRDLLQIESQNIR